MWMSAVTKKEENDRDKDDKYGIDSSNYKTDNKAIYGSVTVALKVPSTFTTHPLSPPQQQGLCTQETLANNGK